jgi:anti-sigma B factor antagonist
MNLELLGLEGNIARLVCEGEITPNIGPGSRNPLEQVLGPGCYGYKVLIDLDRASYINSSGVGWLVGCHKNFERAGGKMVLHSVPPSVDHVLQLLKMHRFFTLAPDEQAATKIVMGDSE